MKVSMVPLKRSRQWRYDSDRQSGLLGNGMMRDDVQGSASALGTGSVECRPLLFGE